MKPSTGLNPPLIMSSRSHSWRCVVVRQNGNFWLEVTRVPPSKLSRAEYPLLLEAVQKCSHLEQRGPKIHRLSNRGRAAWYWVYLP